MGGKSTKTETKNEPPEWAMPMINGAANQWLGTIKGNSGNLAALSKELQGLLPQFRDIALNSHTLDSGKSYLNDVLSGKYLSAENPYMQGMIDQTANDVGGRVNATFSAAGRTGGGANQQILSKGLADAENALRYTNYSNERQAQQQAAGMMPSYRAGELAGLAPLLAAYQTSADLPYSGIKYLNGIGGLWNGYGTQTSEQSGGSPLLGLLGAGLSGWASGGFGGLGGLFGGGGTGLALSDERLKTKIEKVGEAADGLPIVEWNWKSDPDGQRVRGVIAQDVKKHRPWAYVENYRDGYHGVDYAKLGSLA